jgi:hypothetical protein
MSQERYCTICQRALSTQNPGTLCVICQGDITHKLDKKPYYDVEDLKKKLGVSEYQVRRLGRNNEIPGRIPGKQHHYLKAAVDSWIESDFIYNRTNPKPVDPLQEEAYKLCQTGDHGWLTEKRFLGHACTAQTSSELMSYTLQVSTQFKCYFCGHEIVR